MLSKRSRATVDLDVRRQLAQERLVPLDVVLAVYARRRPREHRQRIGFSEVL